MKPTGKQQVNNCLPWSELMNFGFGVLHLDSAQFWKMTLIELHAALRNFAQFDGATAQISRDKLETLAAQFPDHSEH